MGYPIKLAQTAQTLLFLMVDSTDHLTGKTGLTPTVTLSKNGAAFAAPAGAVTELSSGWYKVAGNSTDSGTLGPLLLHATSAGADDTDDRFDVVAYDPQNATNLGLSLMPSNMTQLGGVAQSATDLKDFADAGYDPATNKVQGVVLVDTLSGHTAQTADHTAGIADIPTVAEFNARTLIAAGYFDPATDAVANVTLVATTTTNTDVRGTDLAALASVLGTPAGADVSADIAAVKTDTGNLVTRITATLFSGITSMGEWLGLLAGKQTGNATALTEVKATGAGAGTFDPTTDSNEAIRDGGDANWITGSGGAGLTQQQVRDAMKLAPAAGAPSAGSVDEHLDNMQGATFDTTTDSLEAIRNRGDAAWVTGSAGSGLTALASGTAQGGAVSTIQLAAAETFADGELDGNVAKITGGTGKGQSRLITAYAGATDTATVSPNWTTTPDATSVYEIVDGPSNVVQIEGVDATNQIRDSILSDATTFAGANLDAAVSTRMATTHINATAGKVDGVALVDTTTINTDMRGTEGANTVIPLIAASTATAVALATVQADTDDIQSRLPAALVAGRIDADATAINGSAAAAVRLALSAGSIVVGAAVAGTLSTTQMTTDLTEATTGHYNGRVIIWTSGTLKDQATDVTAYDGTTKALTFTAVTDIPVATDAFILV